MNVGPCFEGHAPRPWLGRYGRIPGNEPAYHLIDVGTEGWWPVIKWQVDGHRVVCPMCESSATYELADAVRAAKRAFGYGGKGSFVINEFGQVIVPSPRGDGNRSIVGTWQGPMGFEDSRFDGVAFDLTDDSGYLAGDLWRRPYVGSQFNLSAANELYFWHENSTGGRPLKPPRQDRHLVGALRGLRPQGPVRFIVIPGGIVVTKVPAGNWDEQVWQARYVGRVDFRCWFPKEE